MSDDRKQERLIRVLERRGRRGFLFLRSAEAFRTPPRVKARPTQPPEVSE